MRTAVTDGDVVQDGILRWTDRVRTAVGLARREPLDDGVVLLDRLVQAFVVRLDEVRSAVAELPSCRGSARARQVAALADGLAESPPETRLRLLIRQAGLPAPVAQYVVRHAARFVAKVDFGYPDRRLAIEYDGLWHGERSQVPKDRARLDRLLAAGWRILFFVTVEDLRRPVELVVRLAAALEA